jgi:hypothetical protein
VFEYLVVWEALGQESASCALETKNGEKSADAQLQQS